MTNIMRRSGFFLLTFAVLAFCTGLASAVPTVTFSEDSGSWVYTPTKAGRGTLSFTPAIVVTKGWGASTSDSLRGALVNIPTMKVTTSRDGQFKLTPTNGAKFSITDATGKTTYLTGTLGTGNLVPAGTTAGSFTLFQGDIRNVKVNNTIDSAALKRVQDMGQNARLDFDMTLNGTKPGVEVMVAQGLSGTSGMSGSAAIIPAPGAILLGSLGVSIVGWLRRRRTL